MLTVSPVFFTAKNTQNPVIIGAVVKGAVHHVQNHHNPDGTAVRRNRFGRIKPDPDPAKPFVPIDERTVIFIY